MVVIAASRRSRRRSSPLRGGHGGGLCPFVAVTAGVFYTNTRNNAKNRFTCNFCLFFSQEPALGLRLFAAFAPPGVFFNKNRRKITKTSQLKSPPLAVGGGHVAVFAAPPWRSRRSLVDKAGGHGGHVRRPTPIWRLKRPNPSFALVAGPRPSSWRTLRLRLRRIETKRRHR